MRHDLENQLCVAQVFTGAAVSANSYKKQTARQDLSIGRRLALIVYPLVASVGGSSWQLEAIQADDGGLTTNVKSIGSITVADADLKPGAELEIPIAQGQMTQMYLGFRATPSGGSGPSVTLDTYIMPQDETPKNSYFPNVTPVLV